MTPPVLKAKNTFGVLVRLYAGRSLNLLYRFGQKKHPQKLRENIWTHWQTACKNIRVASDYRIEVIADD